MAKKNLFKKEEQSSTRKSRSPKGNNFRMGHPCMECERPRTIRGKLCDNCRKRIIKESEKHDV